MLRYYQYQYDQGNITLEEIPEDYRDQIVTSE